jgi:hypothetical protein
MSKLVASEWVVVCRPEQMRAAATLLSCFPRAPCRRFSCSNILPALRRAIESCMRAIKRCATSATRLQVRSWRICACASSARQVQHLHLSGRTRRSTSALRICRPFVPIDRFSFQK